MKEELLKNAEVLRKQEEQLAVELEASELLQILSTQLIQADKKEYFTKKFLIQL